jgi:hypothetical protein
MAKFNGFVAGLTPTTGVANWVLEVVPASGSSIVYIQEFSWGGEATTSTAMRSRIARDSAVGTGARTGGNVQRLDQIVTTPANVSFFTTTYASTQPTIVAGALWGTSWNANGGVIRVLLAKEEEILLYGVSGGTIAAGTASSLECRADVGVATSSYGVVWSEM